MTRARIIFLNRYFYPDHSATSQMLSDLAFGLAARGHQVTVITSRLRYDAPDATLPPAERIRNVDIVRIWTSRFGRHNLAGRAVDYVTFYLSAIWAVFRLARRGDVVVAKTDPPMLGVLTAPIARLRGARPVNWLQDVFPEVAQSLGVGRGRGSGLVYGALRWLRDRSLRRAAMNVALGSRMAERLDALGVARERVRVIPNWADCSLITPQDHDRNTLRQSWGLDGKFVVGYSGNLGRAHDYATLLDAIAALESQAALARRRVTAPVAADADQGREPDIVWLFIGGGAQFEAFKADARQRDLQSVVFQPYQPRDVLSSSLSAADVHLVTLRPELEGLIVPSKFYGVAAAGRPTLFVGDPDGEIARLIRTHACGETVAQGDGKGLADAVLALSHDQARREQMGRRARAACQACST